MTTPRDALRALVHEWRKRANLYDENYAIDLKRCAELAAIVSQMDSEPTVAPPGCERCGELQKSIDNAVLGMNTTAAEWAKVVDHNAELRQQLATAEKTIAELRERVEAAEIRAEAAEACHVESSDIDEDTINYLRDRVLAAERTCEELKAKCGELFAREQVLKDELLRARTADQITNRGG